MTGASGFIGSHLVERLAAENETVRCLVRRSNSLGNLEATGSEVAYADLVTGEGVREALRGIETVFHVAGVIHARTTAEYRAANVEGTRNLLREAAASGVNRLVHVSSVSAFGPTISPRPATEQDTPHPQSKYGRSKLEGEAAVRDSAMRRTSVIVRPSAVYGPRDRDLFPFVRAVSRGRIPVLGEGSNRLQLIYVTDLVSGIVAAARSSAGDGREFFLSNPQAVTWGELGMEAARCLGTRARILRIGRGASLAMAWASERISALTRSSARFTCDLVNEACSDWVVDTSAAAREIGFRSSTSLPEGLCRTVEWYRQAGWLSR